MRISNESFRHDSSISAPDFYEEHAEKYVAATLDVDLTALYERFLPYLPPKARLLDAGSGSGRDTLAFLARGYNVEAFDSSRELCDLSSRITGVRTRHLRFQEFSDVERYDGIWACASLLHVPKTELPNSIARLVRALKTHGALYMSFKHGSGERISSDGRLYTDMTAEELLPILGRIPGVAIAEIWMSEGEGCLKGNDEWLNAIVRRRPDGEQL